jgi:hypothetical protein
MAALPLSGMGFFRRAFGSEQPETINRETREKESAEEFIFWRLKKVVELWPVIVDEPSERFKEKLISELKLSPHRISPKFPKGHPNNLFVVYVTGEAFEACELAEFKTPKFQELKEKVLALREELYTECVREIGPLMDAPPKVCAQAKKIYVRKRPRALEVLKDVNYPLYLKN